MYSPEITNISGTDNPEDRVRYIHWRRDYEQSGERSRSRSDGAIALGRIAQPQ